MHKKLKKRYTKKFEKTNDVINLKTKKQTKHLIIRKSIGLMFA